jgi:PAS domain S-box-containing protein
VAVILCVDDSTDDLALLCCSLKPDESGNRTIALSTIDEVRRTIQSEDVVCIVTEYKLPDGRGLDVLDYLSGNGLDIPVIFFTAHDNEESTAEAFRRGAIDYFVKHSAGNVIMRLRHSVSQAVAAYSDRRARRRVEQSLRGMLAVLPDLHFRLDSRGICLSIEGGDSTKLLVPQEQIIGTNVRDSLPDHIAELVMQNIHKTIASGELQEFSYDLEVPEHGVLNFEARAVACAEDEALIVVRDVTALQRKEQELVELKNRLDATLRSVADGVIAIDTSRTILYSNQGISENISLSSPEDLVGKSLSWIMQDYEFLDENGGSLEQEKMMSSKALRGEPSEDQLIQMRRRGTNLSRWMKTRANPIFDEKGGVSFVVITVTDVTELVETREKIQRHSARLAESNRELESFAYTVSHDLRAPVRRIASYTHILQEVCAGKGDKETHGYLEKIAKICDEMRYLIEALLAFSRSTSVELCLADIDLTHVARTILESRCQELPDRRIETVVHDGLSVHADSNLLQIMLENLLSNAIKFTAGRAPAYIEVGSEVRDGETVFYVRDNGVGFNTESVEKMFEPFVRLHADPSIKGTGVGLSTVRRIVKRHGGRVWAEGTPDQGATICFTLQ